MVRWNNTEASVRLLLFGAIDPPRPGHRIDVITAHLQNVAVSESLTAVADDHDEPLRAHLKHCAKLFDAYRIYRNHFAHDPIDFAKKEDGTFIAFAQTTTSKGGSLRLSQGDVTLSDLLSFRSQLDVFRRYMSGVISHLWGIPGHEPLASLEMPPLPDKLKKHYLNLIERSHRPQARQD